MNNCIWCEYLGHLCPRCMEALLYTQREASPEVAGMILKCGCEYNRGRMIKFCDKHKPED